jgi:hypothetical protein
MILCLALRLIMLKHDGLLKSYKCDSFWLVMLCMSHVRRSDTKCADGEDDRFSRVFPQFESRKRARMSGISQAMSIGA